jgi:hypothetical protein
LIPNALRAIYNNQNSPALRVAYGFGSLAALAVAVLVCGGLIMINDRLPVRWRMGIGVLILVIATASVAKHISGSAQIPAKATRQDALK